MFTTTHTSTLALRAAAFAALALFTIGAMIAPAFASAATYAYVDTMGEVKSITANDWMTAIATAPGIHINSGVMLLLSAADYAVVGDDVVGAK